MSQTPYKNPNSSERLRNNTQNSNTCPQVRGRSRNYQFRLMSTRDAFETRANMPSSPAPPPILNIVVPSHRNSETSVISSRTNVATLNVTSKSSVPSETLNSHEFDADPHFSDEDSWLEQPHPTQKSATKKCQSKPGKIDKCCSKQKNSETPNSMKSCKPKNSSQHDVNYLKTRLVKYSAETECCGDAAKINGELNEIFVRRLVDIENMAKGDTDIKLVTYQEWVDLLMQINEVIIGNMADLESEVAERLENMKRRIKSTCSQTSNIEQKYRQDICSLLKLLKTAYQYDNWDIKGLEFQTVNVNEIFESRKATCLDPEHTNINKHELQDDDQDFRNSVRRRSIF